MVTKPVNNIPGVDYLVINKINKQVSGFRISLYQISFWRNEKLDDYMSLMYVENTRGVE